MDPWELLEYVGETLVFAGVVGEVFAEWNEPERKKLARVSSIVLVLGLALSLAALIGTNEHFNETIAGLNLKSSQATERAAKDEAEAATLKAGNLELGIELAKEEGITAEAEKGIASAKNQAAKAENDLADALKRAASAEKEAADANEKLADRTLSDVQQQAIAEKLVIFAGQEYKVTAYWDSQESLGIANRIHQSLQMARWKYLIPESGSALLGGIVGVQVWHHPDADDSTKRAAQALIDALNSEGISAFDKVENPTNNPKHNFISMNVGSKR